MNTINNLITQLNKLCSRCRELKPLSEFWKDKNYKSGLSNICKKCQVKYKNKNQEKLFQEHQKYQLENPIEFKLCSCCGQVKHINEFCKDKTRKDGFYPQCKSCVKEYENTNREKLLQKHKKHQLENPTLFRTCSRCKIKKSVVEFYKSIGKKSGYSSLCKSCEDKRVKQWELKNPEKVKQRYERFILNHPRVKKERHLKTKDEIKQRKKEWNVKNKDKNKQQHRIWCVNNNGHIKQYKKQRYDTDINYKVSCVCRQIVRNAIKGNTKLEHTMTYMMCLIREFVVHIEKQWLPGMTWANYGNGPGKWNIDHIIPISFFNLLDEVEKYMCCRYQNLRPLWWEDNMAKGKKVVINL